MSKQAGASGSARRGIVGIDLGTTNTVVAKIEGDAIPSPEQLRLEPRACPRPELEPLVQLTAPGEWERRELLPSALYLPAPGEFGPDNEALSLPWGRSEIVVGAMALEHGAKVPGRLITSAKSWLCHRKADPREALLPLEAAPELERMSPVEASRRILEHVRAAWSYAHPDAPIPGPELLLTVPASFDVVARALTLDAAREAGLGELTLLEEPQAAFYAWLAQVGEGWREQIAVGDVVLVCDIGGGTSDFSLIAACEKDGVLWLERLAVGEHLLLGGDNMDLALAHRLASRLDQPLDPWRSRALWLAASRAKEALLSDPGLDRITVSVAGRGRRLIGGQLQVELTQRDIEEVVLEGFFPRVDSEARPQTTRRVALQSLGLPYAQDAAITRHLAAFLARHLSAEKGPDGVRRFPTQVLFNGGVMASERLRSRLLEVLSSWSGEPVRELQGADLAGAVARGAAYYGLVRRGGGVRIRGGSARSYYVGFEAAAPAVPGLEPPMHAVCVVPFGLEEGSELDVPGLELGLVVGEPVDFRLFASTERKDDRPGARFERLPPEFEEVARLEATLEREPSPAPAARAASDREALEQGADEAAGAQPEVVPVGLHARLNEVGTLELECVSRVDPRRWRLEVDLRANERAGAAD